MELSETHIRGLVLYHFNSGLKTTELATASTVSFATTPSLNARHGIPSLSFTTETATLKTCSVR